MDISQLGLLSLLVLLGENHAATPSSAIPVTTRLQEERRWAAGSRAGILALQICQVELAAKCFFPIDSEVAILQ